MVKHKFSINAIIIYNDDDFQSSCISECFKLDEENANRLDLSLDELLAAAKELFKNKHLLYKNVSEIFLL